METLPPLLRGIILGLSIAAPVGPIGLLCIQRTLSHGRLAGLLSGLGAATADAVYGTIAAFGVAFLSTFLIRQQAWLRLLGGAFLVVLGVRTFLSRPATRPAVAAGRTLFSAYASALLLTLANPITILSFVAIFAGMGAAGPSHLAAIALVLGVFVGSALWWLLLSTGVSLLRGSLSPQRLVWVNRVSGLVIIGLGLSALLGGV